MQESWRIELLGGLRLRKGDCVITHFRTRKTGGLLSYLGFFRQRLHHREKLIDMLWPESELEAGRQSLSRALSALRQQLEPNGTPAGSVLVADRLSVGLNPEAATTDVADFEEALARAGKATDDASRAQHLQAAIEVYQGELLPGYYDDWVLEQQERLAGLYVDALGQTIPLLERAGDLHRALEYARRAVAADPLREEAHLDLIRLYTLTGQPSAAQRQYRRLQETFEEELGAQPSPSTQAAAKELLSRSYAVTLRSQEPPQPQAPETQPAEPPAAPVEAQATLPPREPVTAPAPANPRKEPVSLPPNDDGENRLMTVLVMAAEPRGGNGAQDPDDLAARLSGLVEAAEDVVEHYGGYIDRFPDGRLLALFGAPRAREDDPERALQAALEIRRAAADQGLSVRIGASSGQAYVGGLGQQSRTRVMIVGDAIDTANQLAGSAEPGQILVSPTTYDSTARAFDFKPLPASGPSGLGPVYSLQRPLSHPEKARGIDGLRAELVGRDHELQHLRKAAHALREGRGQVVCVVGDAGVGKSRLVQEFRKVLEADFGADGILWLEGCCSERGPKALPQILTRLLQVRCPGWNSPIDDPAAAASTLLNQMASAAPSLAECCKEAPVILANLLRMQDGVGESQAQPLSQPQRQQVLTALRGVLVSQSRQGPLVLVLDDLHWADDLCLDLICLLIESLSEAPILLICLYRPERERRCSLLRRFAERACADRLTDLHLCHLTDQQTRELLASLLGQEDLPEPLVRVALERSHGNPFFLEEVVRSLISSGHLRQEGGRWQAVEGLEQAAVPISIQRVLLSWVDRLSPEAKQVLQMAAVIGPTFPKRLLQAAIGDELPLNGPLWEMESLALVYRSQVLPEDEYSFQHRLAQETVYQSLVGRHRRVLHQRVAEAMDRVYADCLEPHLEQLALHYERAGDLERAERLRAQYRGSVSAPADGDETPEPLELLGGPRAAVG